MTVVNPDVHELTRHLRAENDSLSKALACHREFLADLGVSLGDSGYVDGPSLARLIDRFLTDSEAW